MIIHKTFILKIWKSLLGLQVFLIYFLLFYLHFLTFLLICLDGNLYISFFFSSKKSVLVCSSLSCSQYCIYLTSAFLLRMILATLTDLLQNLREQNLISCSSHRPTGGLGQLRKPGFLHLCSWVFSVLCFWQWMAKRKCGTQESL